MNKRKRSADEERECVLEREGPLTEEPIENEYEHLDDEEDENDIDEDGALRSTRLRKDEYEEILQAQEPATVAREGDVKFTPFNLTEELEEGDFDKTGNFVFKKKHDNDDEEEDDNWAETVDWTEVERKERDASTKMPVEQITDEQSTSNIIVQDKCTCYKQMLRIMRADETVQRTIQRLGKQIPRRRPVKKGADVSGQYSTDKSLIEKAKFELDRMIEFADLRFREGESDIYERTYEDLEEAINC